MKRYETDVLIVGGGGAATAATISAHQAGARTVMAVKGRFGVPGATLGTSSFGKITSADTPRNQQLGLKLVW